MLTPHEIVTLYAVQYLTNKSMLSPILSGDVLFTDGGLSYGSMFGNDLTWSQAAAVSMDWYPIADAGIDTGELHNITHDDAGILTVTYAGKYLVNYGMCVSTSSPHQILRSGILQNGAISTKGRSRFETQGANEVGHESSTAILDCAAGETIQLALSAEGGAAPTISVNQVNLSMVQVGG